MQAVWLAFDEIAGKGIDLIFILKFLYYLALMVVPTALPIGVLLSSIMALGTLSENYEFAAIKSAGLSLQRFIRPLIILTIIISAFNFLFLNYVYPYATLKQKNLYINIKKKKPALALVPGAFNTEIPGYSIKFEEKTEREEQTFLKNIQIADLSANKGKIKVITAEEGIINTEEGSKYMTLILNNGNYYEDYVIKGNRDKRSRMPFSEAKFKTYTINIDISSFDDADLDEENYKEVHTMLSLSQLKDKSDNDKINYTEFVESRAKSLQTRAKANELYKKPDSIINKKLKPEILDNFDIEHKSTVLNAAIQTLNRTIENNKTYKNTFKTKRKSLNLYDFEYTNRIAMSLACLILFFIGAPLGSIIRKGGFGLPMILAILIFVVYWFITSFGKNLAEESAVTALLGSWLATIILLPFGILLTRRATKDMGIFNVDLVLNNVIEFFKKLIKPFNKNAI